MIYIVVLKDVSCVCVNNKLITLPTLQDLVPERGATTMIVDLFISSRRRIQGKRAWFFVVSNIVYNQIFVINNTIMGFCVSFIIIAIEGICHDEKGLTHLKGSTQLGYCSILSSKRLPAAKTSLYLCCLMSTRCLPSGYSGPIAKTKYRVQHGFTFSKRITRLLLY